MIPQRPLHRPTLKSADLTRQAPLVALVAQIIRDDLPTAFELVGLVQSGRVDELAHQGAHGRYVLSSRGAWFARKGEVVMRHATLDEWERCVREIWTWARRRAAAARGG